MASRHNEINVGQNRRDSSARRLRVPLAIKGEKSLGKAVIICETLQEAVDALESLVEFEFQKIEVTRYEVV